MSEYTPPKATLTVSSPTTPSPAIKSTDILEDHSNRNSLASSSEDKRLSQVSSSASKKTKTHVGPWRLGRTLGRGSSGRVRLAKHTVTGRLAAVKIVPKSAVSSDPDRSDKAPYGIEREVIIMKLIEHQNVMALYDVWENRGEL